MLFEKILVRATNWVGDAVMSLPALQALRIQYPTAHIALLARPWVADLYGRETFCDEVIAYGSPSGLRRVQTIQTIASGLRARRFDCAICLPNSFESALVLRLARIPVRIGYSRDGRGFLLTHPIRVPKRGEIPGHQRFYYLEMLRRAGIISEYSHTQEIRLGSRKAATERGREAFRELSMFDAVCGISPGAAYGGAKRWIPSRFAQTADQIAGNSRMSFALFGSQQERAIGDLVAEELSRLGRRAINLAGRTTLAQFIEYAAACELFLTNDSGPMHIASALGVPTVAIFGATDPIATGPTGATSAVVREQVDCSPCLLRECPIDHRCMTRVTAERVAGEALTLLRQTSDARR